MAIRTSEIVLDAEGIDEASEIVASFLEDAGLDRRSILSARLTFESALLRLREHFGDGVPAQILVGKRFGRPRLMVKVKGSQFDPREMGEGSDWERSLMEAAGLRPTYAYRGGFNIISISCPRGPMGSTLRAFVAIALGVVLARAGLRLPAEVRQTLLEGLITPIFNTFIGMLSGIAGPMVFFSVAWGICGIGDMAALGRSGKVLITKFMLASAAAGTFALVVCLPIFHLQGGTGTGGTNALNDVVNLVLGLLPTNMVQPFVEGNTLQIIFLSVAFGVAALALGDVTEGVRNGLREINALVQFLMEQLCRLLPGFITIMIISQTWEGTMGALLSSWLPILVAGAGMAAFLALLVTFVAMRCRLSIKALIIAIFPALFLTCTTASSSASFGTMVSICEDDFGIDEDQTSFGVPLGMVLCKTGMPILLTTIMFYSAQSFGVGVSALWFVRLWISCLLYSIAVPPVPGGSLACYGMMLPALGVPLDALAVCTALDMLLDNLSASGNVGGLLMQMLSSADTLGAIDRDKLAKLAR